MRGMLQDTIQEYVGPRPSSMLDSNRYAAAPRAVNAAPSADRYSAAPDRYSTADAYSYPAAPDHYPATAVSQYSYAATPDRYTAATPGRIAAALAVPRGGKPLQNSLLLVLAEAAAHGG